MKPRLLDLFCGAGGAAMGYHRAGFEVVGVDIEPQPNYCGDEFYQGDALGLLTSLSEPMSFLWKYRLENFDAIHASPPCQGYANVTQWRGDQDEHPALIEPARDLLKTTGLPYVIENVRTKALSPCVVLCGSMFGLPIRRHRGFETNWAPSPLVLSCHHRSTDYSFDHGGKQPESVYRDAMGCEWMTVEESREAIPPAFTEYVGLQLIQQLQKAAA